MTETEDGTAKTKNKKASGDDAEQGKEGLEDGSDPPENMSDWHKVCMVRHFSMLIKKYILYARV